VAGHTPITLAGKEAQMHRSKVRKVLCISYLSPGCRQSPEWTVVQLICDTPI
jgi:hypothetical protein